MSVIKLVVAGCLLSAAAYAETKGYYGVVESYGDGKVVIRTKEKSVGTWTVDTKTKVTGTVQVDDWVHADVETSGHVVTLKSEEHATPHAGLVKSVKGNVLTVESGKSAVNWNMTPETAFRGVERDAIKAGDNISTKVYKNRNLAEVTFIKHVD